jgi:peptidoglycan/xylan/chitin deacetylase (PgdA/CDA1 family)
MNILSPSRSLRRLLSVGMLVCATAAVADEPAFPANGGFEKGLEAWRYGSVAFQAVPEAACSGTLGLRVTDDDTVQSFTIMSSSYPVNPGQTVTLTFNARANNSFLAVGLWPKNAAGQLVKDFSAGRDGVRQVAVKKSEDWKPYTVTTTIPEGATSVAIWVHTWSSPAGVADLDDFVLEGIEPGTAPLETPEQLAAASAAALAREAARKEQEKIPDEIPPRPAPPVVILKLDDLKQQDGKVHHLWTRTMDYLANRNIKAGVGVICKTLEEATPEYIDWICKRHDSGLVEFWFHAWDHGVWKTESGKQLSEFDGRPVEEQAKRLADSQRLAKEKLGFAFKTFGPPGGGHGPHQDAATAQVMSEDPDIKVWLYPSPIDAMGRKLAEEGKLTILDRVWAVDLEYQVGQPNFKRFVAGYARNPDREYFVLQGHPMHWDSTRFEEFKKIIDFLVEQNAVFMTPSEYAASLNGRPAQQVPPKKS